MVNRRGHSTRRAIPGKDCGSARMPAPSVWRSICHHETDLTLVYRRRTGLDRRLPGPNDRPAPPAERPSGTGVIVHSDGYVLTAHHVIANARRVVVVTPGEVRTSAIVVSTDPEHDLALLKVRNGRPLRSLDRSCSNRPAGSGSRRRWVSVRVAGRSVTRGRIAAVRTKGVQRVFQVDAAINPGNSGGTFI